MIELKKGTTRHPGRTIALGSGLILTQDTDGRPQVELDPNGSASVQVQDADSNAGANTFVFQGAVVSVSGGVATFDLDSRYSQKGHTHEYTSRASGSGAQNSVYVSDTRDTNYAPQDRPRGFYFDFKANATDGLNDSGTYHGVLTFRQWGSSTDFSGGNAHQMGFTDNGSLWLRRSTSATAWDAWKRVYDTGRDPGLNRIGPPTGYGAIQVTGGSGNGTGWTGIQFPAYNRTLLINAGYQGIYDEPNATWKWRFNNGVLDVGTVPWGQVTGEPDFARRDQVNFFQEAQVLDAPIPADGGSSIGHAVHFRGKYDSNTGAGALNAANVDVLLRLIPEMNGTGRLQFADINVNQIAYLSTGGAFWAKSNITAGSAQFHGDGAYMGLYSTDVRFLTSGGGALAGKFKSILLSDSYSTDPGTYRLYVNGSALATEAYAWNWVRTATGGSRTGIYWQAGPGAGWHIYHRNATDGATTPKYMDLMIRSGSTQNSSIAFTVNDETPRGYIHWTTDNRIGFLTSGRGWALYVDSNADIKDRYNQTVPSIIVSATAPADAREGSLWAVV